MTEEQRKLLADLCKQAKLPPAALLANGNVKLTSQTPFTDETLKLFSLYDWEKVESGDYPLMTDRPDEMKYEYYVILRPTFIE